MKKEWKIDSKSMIERGWEKWTPHENSFSHIAFLNFLVGLPFLLYIIIMYPSWITFGILATQIAYYFSDNRIFKGLLDILYIVGIILFAIIYYHG